MGGKVLTKNQKPFIGITPTHFMLFAGGVAIVSALLTRLGLALSDEAWGASALWPSAGLVLAAMLLGGFYALIPCLLGSFAVLMWIGVPLTSASLVVVMGGMEGVLGALILWRWAPTVTQFSTIRDIFKFLIVAALIPVPTALVGAWQIVSTRNADPDLFLNELLVWWRGDFNGIIVVTPFICLWFLTYLKRGEGLSPRSFLLILLSSSLATTLIFLDPVGLGEKGTSLAYVPFLFAFWGALRFGGVGAISTIVTIIVPAIGFSMTGSGPFVRGDPMDSLLLVQGFLVIMAVMALSFSAALAERDAATRQSRTLSQAVEQSATVVIITSPNGSITYVNPAFTTLTGYTLDDVRGKNPRLLKSGYTSSQDYVALWQTIRQGRTWRGEFLNRRKDGGVIWERATISPVRNEDGKIAHFVSTGEDVTARKAGEERLRRALSASEQAKNELERITFAVTHTLQEPLRSIGGFAQLLQKRYTDSMDETAIGYLQRIVEATDRMHHLFHDLMHYAMVDDQVDTGDIDLNDVVRTAVAALGGDVHEKVTIAHSLPVVHGVTQQVQRVFEHLLSNSIKYQSAERPLQIVVDVVENTPFDESLLGSSAQVVSRREGMEQTASGRYCHISVSDNGMGIDPAFQSRLFLLFSRLHTMETYEGTGVGLAYCRRVIERHGGHIWMQSVPDQGTAIHFTLPKPDPQSTP